MTVDQLEGLLKGSGYPVAYHHFNKPPKIPYIVYLFPGSSNFMADGRVYLPIERLAVELYTERKDYAAEKRVADLLTQAGIPYQRSEVYIDSERLYRITFESEVFMDGKKQGSIQP